MSDDARQEQKRRPGYIHDPAAPLPEHLMPKAEEPPKRGRLKDTDSAETVFRMRAFVYSGAGLVIGTLGGVGVVLRGGSPLMIPVMAIGGWALSFYGTLGFAERAGRVGAGLYFTRSPRVRPVRQYSLADAMIARDRFADAGAELQQAADACPEDPEPYLRLARLQRDHMRRYEEAVQSFRHAVVRPGCDASTEIGATRELIEIYTHRLEMPRRALPDLARLAARHPNTPAAAWARRQISEIKQEMRQDDAPG